jgi:hypothetical protein
MAHNEAASSTKNAEPEHTLSYGMARINTRILELESRCAVIRTVGSNPTPLRKGLADFRGFPL